MTEMDHFIALAESIAREKHVDQLDRGGNPYIDHPRRVASYVERIATKLGCADDEVAVLVAGGWLHDTLEDTDTTPQELFERGIPDDVVELVDIVTRRDWETYDQFISRILLSRRAQILKLADITDNMDANRADGSTASLQGRYLRARTRIIHKLGVVV